MTKKITQKIANICVKFSLERFQYKRYLGGDRDLILLTAELLSISASAAEALVCSCPPYVSRRAFFRGLSDGEYFHPALNQVGRLRLSAMFKLHILMSEERFDIARDPMSWGELQRYLIEVLDGRTRETFIAVFLDARHQFITSEILFVGSIDSACVHHRVALTRALSHHAVSIVVAHNHPSGSLIPSDADIETTRKLARCLKFVDIALADHIIVASGRCQSLRNLGFV